LVLAGTTKQAVKGVKKAAPQATQKVKQLPQKAKQVSINALQT